MNIPEKFGRYTIKERLGRGGMASVYLAHDPRFEREVAIKILPQEVADDTTFRQRFEREARAIAALEHPAIVPVYDFAEENGQPYIVMRLMKGGSLAERIKNGPLSLLEAGRILERLAQALDAAHQRGIIHRDLKPGNILFDEYDNAYLSDFGIAHIAGSGSTLTGTGVIGTPAYMSPEQVQGGEKLDARSDVYSLGIILYQMLTGQAPYQADTPARVMMAHILDTPTPILSLQPDLPPECETIIQKALAKNREERYDSAGALAADFNALLRAAAPTPISPPAYQSASTVKARPVVAQEAVSPPETPTGVARQVHAMPPPTQTASTASRFPIWIFVVGGLALFGLLSTGGWFLFQSGRSTPPPLSPTSNNLAISASQTAVAMAAEQSSPTASPQPSKTTPPQPSDTPAPLPSNTPTPMPQPSDTPTVMPTATPAPLALGGADEIAFLRNNDVWVVGLDGSNLRQLTKDGGEKNLLQWTPDASAVTYILGTCVHSVNAESGRDELLLCLQAVEHLEDFQISPDGSQVAMSIDRQLFVVPFDLQALAQARLRTDIQRMGTCTSLAPYTRNAVKEVRWSADGTLLALKLIGNDGQGRQVDLVDVVRIKNCPDTPPRVDEFPATRFTINTYAKTPIIENFSWDGLFLFALTGYTRNDGFGDLYIYNHDLHKADLEVNPIDGVCCYRDPHFSPNGQYLAFAFQDIRAGAENPIDLYYIDTSTLGTGVHYQPIPLPENFFSNPREKPQPLPRPLRP